MLENVANILSEINNFHGNLTFTVGIITHACMHAYIYIYTYIHTYMMAVYSLNEHDHR